MECRSTDGIGLRGIYARVIAALGGSLPFSILADENGRVPERTKNAGRVTTENGPKDAEWQVFAEGSMNTTEAVRRELAFASLPTSPCGLREDPGKAGSYLSPTNSTIAQWPLVLCKTDLNFPGFVQDA